MLKQLSLKTENGVDLSNYIADKAANRIAITAGLAGNFVAQSAQYDMDTTTTPPTVKTVIGEPKNINAASITALRTGLDALEAEIATARAELDAAAADMAG
jgi:hypothetical protein